MYKTVRRLLAWSAGGVAVVAAWVYFSTYHPGAVEPEPVVTVANAPLLQPGQQFKVLTWNVQFMAGNKNNHFFFDGGKDPWPSLETQSKVTEQVAAILRAEDPDIILLQELDQGARRSYFQDQLLELLRLLPHHYVSHTSSYYWKAGYVPHPELMGAAGMKLSIISKYRIEEARRYALSAITTDNLLRRQFNVKRGVLGVELPIEGGDSLNVLNTHLSAFTQGTDTKARQVSQLNVLLSRFADAGKLALMGGDFNMVPSRSAYRRLSGRNREYYNPRETEIAPLLAQFCSVPSLEETDGEDHARWYTHMATYSQSKLPDKTIDYIFTTGELTLGDHYVLGTGTQAISDHLPVVATFTLPGAFQHR
jgi:endonuclease/exonuclease/phosphatase family metal-dependent hydrolase